jgi:hypothetical protein
MLNIKLFFNFIIQGALYLHGMKIEKIIKYYKNGVKKEQILNRTKNYF